MRINVAEYLVQHTVVGQAETEDIPLVEQQAYWMKHSQHLAAAFTHAWTQQITEQSRLVR